MNFILFGVFSAILSLPVTTMTLKTMKKLSPKDAELLKSKNTHIYATAFFNLGNCYHKMENFKKGCTLHRTSLGSIQKNKL